jgi:hypothetical protein
MNQVDSTIAANPDRQAAYRRLALTILALDVPTLAARLHAARHTASAVPARQSQLQAA